MSELLSPISENASIFVPRARLARVWPAVVVAWIVLLTLLVGWTTYTITEPLDGDAVGFLPQIIHFKKDGQLVNELYERAFRYSPQRDGRYVWHGILFPLLTAKLIPQADYESVVHVLLAYEVITLTAMGILLVQMRPKRWLEAVAMLCAPLVVTSWQTGLSARPEVLVITWIAIGLAAFMRSSPRSQPWIAGVVIGLVAATSPIPGALLGLIYSTYLSLVSGRTCLRISALVALVAVSIFFSVFAFYPYTIAEWVRATLLHADDSVVGYYRQPFVLTWLLNKDRPLMAVWAAVFVAVAWLFYRRSTSPLKSWPVGFFVLATATIALASYTSPDARNYNVAALAPIIIVAIPLFAWQPSKHLSLWKCSMRVGAIVILTALSAMPLLRQSLLKVYSHHGLDRTSAKAILSDLRKDHAHVAVSMGLFVLCEDTRDLRTMETFDYADRETIKSNADIVLIQQLNPYKSQPASYRNYALEHSYFVSYAPTFLGIQLAKSPRAFNFAVYRKLPVVAREVAATATALTP